MIMYKKFFPGLLVFFFLHWLRAKSLIGLIDCDFYIRVAWQSVRNMPATHVHVGGDPVIAEGDTDRHIDAEKSGLENTNDTLSSNNEDSDLLYGATSPGVRRIEIISAQFRTIDKVFFLFSIFLVSYAYGLDLQVRSTYQVCRTRLLHPDDC